MAIVGGAIIPVVQGAAGRRDRASTTASSSPVLCYVYIAWYGLSFRSLDKSTARAA